MVTKQFRITVGLLALAAMASVAALGGPVFVRAEPQQSKKPPLPKQNNPPAPPRVQEIPAATYLKCSWFQYKNGGVLTITNTTDFEIPWGKTVYWSLNGQTKGSFRLGIKLAPGLIHAQSVCCGIGSDPKAWYEGPVFGKVPENKKMPSSEQQNPPTPPNVPKIPAITYLKAKVIGCGNPDHWCVVVTNISSSTIPKGTMIYWSLNPVHKGSLTLQYDSPPGANAGGLNAPDGWNRIGLQLDAKAWYYK